jgi:hypothetical protein
MPKGHPRFSRTIEERGLDAVDTPEFAFLPLFDHEPLLAGVREIAEPAAGAGAMVIPLRKRGIHVHAADVAPRGCPNCKTADFLKTRTLPPGCDVLWTNPPFSRALPFILHSLVLGYRIVILLLRLQFLTSAERYDRLYPLGRLRRVHVVTNRITMHDVNHLAAGGKTASQSQDHAWYVFDATYFGAPTINFMSKNNPARMPWATW